MTEWRTVERPSTLSVQPRAQVVGDIPDAHVITVRERRVTVDYPTIIQNNVNTDVIELDLDGEWDDMSVVLVLGPCGGATELAWHGEPLTLPSALAEDTGGIDVSVVGYSADGETRLVTVAAPSLLNVIKSGCTVGEAPAEETPDLIGQLVAAGDAANKAAQSANAAAEEANGAAVAARTAASAANTAAGKASTAAADASGAAEVASDAAGDADRAAQSANAAAEAASAAAEAARGNVLKGTLGPEPLLSADDAYATKPRKLTVHGATRQNLWVNPRTYTQSGVTLNSNHDGSMSISGTSTARVAINKENIMVLKPSTTYTLSVDKQTPSGARFRVGVNYDEGTYVEADAAVGGYTFKTPSVVYRAVFQLSIDSGVTVSGTYRVMINEGSEPEPWCPPGLNSVDELSIVTAGKNLAEPQLYVAGYSFGYPIARSDRSSMTKAVLPYTTEREYRGVGAYFYAVGGKTYTLSQKNAPEGAKLSFNQFWPGQGLVSGDASGSTGCFGLTASTPPRAVKFERSGLVFVLSAMDDSSVGITWPEDFGIQVEFGSTATDYEPPTVTTTPLPEVELRSLPNGTCDELVIRADGTCEVERNTVQVTFDGSEDEDWVLRTSDNGHGIANFRIMSSSYSTSKMSVMCDTLPVDNAIQADATQAGILMSDKSLYIRLPSTTADTVKELRAWLGTNPTTVVFTNSSIGDTEPQSPVTLPTLPAPTVNVYADAEASGAGYAMDPDVELEYERDVTIAFNNLQAQISATTVREATNG